MTSFQQTQAATLPDVVSAVQIDPETRTTVPLSAEQSAVAAAAALAVISAAGVTADAAAHADFDREGWDMAGFPEPEPATLGIAHVWGEAQAAAHDALAERWPELDTSWIALTLDEEAEAA